jgi:hypothetical protein
MSEGTCCSGCFEVCLKRHVAVMAVRRVCLMGHVAVVALCYV